MNADVVEATYQKAYRAYRQARKESDGAHTLDLRNSIERKFKYRKNELFHLILFVEKVSEFCGGTLDSLVVTLHTEYVAQMFGQRR